MIALMSFLPLFRTRALRFGLAFGLGALTLVAGMALLGVSGWFLTAAALTTAAASFNLFGPSSLIRGFSLIRIGARYGEKLVGHDATLWLLADLRGWLFSRLIPRMPLKDTGISHGDLVSRLTADIDTLDTAFLVAIGPMLTALVLGATMGAILGWYIPAGAVVYAVTLATATLAVPAVLVGATLAQGRSVIAASAAVRSAALQSMDGLADFIVFDQIAMAEKQFDDAANAVGSARRRLALRGSIASAMVQLLAGTALVGVLWFGIQSFQRGDIGGPLLVGLLLATLASFEATGAIVRSVSRLSSSIAAAEQIRAVADSPPAVVDPGRPVAMPEGNDIAFHGVRFGHHADRTILVDVSFKVATGSRVVILGASGSGKSTLMALLLRLFDPQAGTITLGDIDLRWLRQDELHRRIALLTQDTQVFMGSLRDNLLMGDPGASSERLWHMLDAVRLGDVVRRLPDQLDGYVGEKGWTLSAGQARRLCLARALLSKAQILVLDEPTSNLDPETERAFFEDLCNLATGKTVILATHAKPPSGVFDQCYVMTAGKLAVSGATATEEPRGPSVENVPLWSVPKDC
ncbi:MULTISPECIES: thiol reductant ABC exporter subunit CydC [unclassified Rhizobium]|uniref:thiol reductant ABC exporter subunit CydC n=1 Tax=unclassified Rhizobium TaxID=2613769 RepID=UPI001ADC0494|nr:MULTISPECIES: thiol reductant ABC exporter subunit CydC [unclassified Rhizobium]MBO9101616.1 thiol reductant ABC exporter subunit CydC [Rhizobium sp. L58/93]MBO9187609.1 thiol reductant ABC exporter subunit CydC [Rhizobium sp. E27B/91]QXZ86611.1 thiol reductant ABC exporter subunit CydC [Rhizobium sp. K1/93]QXZ93356.1 thiol reductant ABC exporter subunit CydC [Rhizobium sp. K15/93]